MGKRSTGRDVAIYWVFVVITSETEWGWCRSFESCFQKNSCGGFPSDVKSVRQWVLWRRTRKYPTQNSLHRLRLYCFFWTVILTTKAVWFLSNRFGTWTELPGTWTRVADVSKKQTILSYYCYDACYYSRTCLNFRRIIFQHKQANKSIRCCRSMFGSRSRC